MYEGSSRVRVAEWRLDGETSAVKTGILLSDPFD